MLFKLKTCDVSFIISYFCDFLLSPCMDVICAAMLCCGVRKLLVKGLPGENVVYLFRVTGLNYQRYRLAQILFLESLSPSLTPAAMLRFHIDIS